MRAVTAEVVVMVVDLNKFDQLWHWFCISCSLHASGYLTGRHTFEEIFL
jgi:hypothetical protein